MSRSRRKTPIVGVCSGSEKKDKRFANRALRKTIKQKLINEVDENLLPIMNEKTQIYSWNKDGKIYFGNVESKKYFRKLLRK